jgi:Cyclin, N-terminal domain
MQTQKTFNTQRGTRRYFGKDLTNLEEDNPRTFGGKNDTVLDHDSAILSKKTAGQTFGMQQTAAASQTRYKLNQSDMLGKKAHSNQSSAVTQNQSLSTSISKNSQSQNFTKPGQTSSLLTQLEQPPRRSAMSYSGINPCNIGEHSQPSGGESANHYDDYQNLGFCPSPAHVQNQKGPATHIGPGLHTRNSSGLNRSSLGSSNNLISGTPNNQLSWTPVIHQAHHDYLHGAAHKPGPGWEKLDEMSVERSELAWRRKMMEEGFEPAPERIVEHAGMAFGYPAPNLRMARSSSQISVENPRELTAHQMQEEVIPSRYQRKKSTSPMISEGLSASTNKQPGPIWEEPSLSRSHTLTHHADLVFEHLEVASAPGSEFIDFNGIPFSRIWGHLLSAKHVNTCSSSYLLQHRDITEDMRDIVIDWLVDVHRKFKMKTETLFQALSLMDRYLERNEIKKEIFQLVATTCLFITSKFEEIYPPVLEDFVYICADTYTKNEIIHMEALILNDVGFRLVTSTSHTLIGIYATQSRYLPNS